MAKLKTYKSQDTLFSDIVHSSVPKHVTKRDATTDWEELKQAILRIVLPGCRPIPSGEIYKRVQSLISFELKTDETYRPIRKACKLLLEEDQEPIVSSGKGFFYATGKADIIQMMKTNSERMKGIERAQVTLGRILEQM